MLATLMTPPSWPFHRSRGGQQSGLAPRVVTRAIIKTLAPNNGTAKGVNFTLLLNANEVLQLLQWRWHLESAESLFDAKKVPKNNALLADIGGWGASGNRSAIPRTGCQSLPLFEGGQRDRASCCDEYLRTHQLFSSFSPLA